MIQELEKQIIALETDTTVQSLDTFLSGYTVLESSISDLAKKLGR